jgi:DNA invertase Pin-like site-specific DNA recombinase
MKRVLLYARTSTSRDQRPEMQLDELRVLAKQRGWQIVGEYVDRGVSGSKDRRPQLDQLTADVAKGKADIVAVYRFDRFARSVRHLITALEDFRVRGVEFLSLYDNVDTTTATGRFVFTMIAGFAELEREIIRERVVSGVQAARRRGKRLGRPPVVVDVTRALAMKAAGASNREIGRKLGVAAGTIAKAIAQTGQAAAQESSSSELLQSSEMGWAA